MESNKILLDLVEHDKSFKCLIRDVAVKYMEKFMYTYEHKIFILGQSGIMT